MPADTLQAQYFKVTLLGEDSKVKEALERLAELTENERGMVLALTHSSVKRTERGMEGVEKSTKKIEKGVEGMTTILNDSKSKNGEEEVRNVLRAELDGEAVTKVLKLNETLNEQRLPRSGDWLLREPLFREWVHRKISLLWLLGGPGAGKSFLSSRIISHLKDVRSQQVPLPVATSVAFFYIKEDDSQLRSMTTILKSIASQIAKSDPTFRNHAVNVCQSPEDLLAVTQTWERLFIDYFASTWNDNCVYIVIDGLDEVSREERETLLILLVQLFDAPSGRIAPRIQVLLVGRPELQDDMQMVWDDRTFQLGKRFIEVSAKKNSGDISEYITREVEKVRILKLKALSRDDRSALRMEIVEKLKTDANGMFLWVNLMLEEIRRKSRPSEVRAALRNAPQDLMKMIQHGFERLAADPGFNKDDFNEMLVWVACAERPLLLGELDLILKLRSPVKEAVLGLEADLRGRYASFFTLRRADGRTTEDLQWDADHSSKLEHEEHRQIKDGLNERSDNEFDEEQGYQSKPASTTVEFSHASVRDYLRQEGMPAELGIGIEMKYTQLRIATICLSVIADDERWTRYGGLNLLNYAAPYFLQHLVQVDRSKLNNDDKQKILPRLYSFFHNESMMQRWYDSLAKQDRETFITSWFANNGFAKEIRCWFKEKVYLDSLSPEDCAWAEKAASSTKELLKPLAFFFARRWLQSRFMVHNDCVMFLHYYLSIDEGSITHDVGAAIGKKLARLSSLSSERIRKLAKFAGLEETSNWHCALAYILQVSEHVDHAVEEYEVAIRMDDRNWQALYLMGYCCGIKCKSSRPIDWYLRALEVLPQEDSFWRCYIWNLIGTCRNQVGDLEGAVEASRQACLTDPENLDAVGRQLEYLHNSFRYQETINLVEKLDKRPARFGKGSELTDLLHQAAVHLPIATAARALGKLNFAIDAFERAITVTEKMNDDYELNQQNRLAQVYYLLADNEDRAVQLWEGVIANSATYTDLPKSAALNSMSEVYFDRARAAENSEADPAVWVSQLQRLSKIALGLYDSEGDDFMRRFRDPSLMLGLWYRLHGKQNEAEACFRLTILDGIDVLTDENPYNDIVGYMSLMRALLKAGDRANAMAAAAFLSTGLDTFKAERAAKADASHKADKVCAGTDMETRDEKGLEGTELASAELAVATEPEHETGISGAFADHVDGVVRAEESTNADNEVMPCVTGSPLIGCNGRCMRGWAAITAYYLCETCLWITFCDACFQLNKAKKLPYRFCNPDHCFVQIYPLPDKVEEIALTKVDGQTRPNQAWLDKLKKEWAT